MATWYAKQQVGVADGTKIPPNKASGSEVGAKVSVHVASKNAGEVWANGDVIYLGKLRKGEHLRRVWLNSDTSFGTTTVSIGTLAVPAKYVSAKTMTVVDTPTMLGPKASTADDGPLTADEDIYATLAVGGVAGVVLASFELEFASVK